jgi:hypothetical protein
MVSHFDPSDILAHGLDHTGALVPGHQRQSHGYATLEVAEITMAIARVQPLDKRLTGSWGLELKFFDAVGLADFA